MPGGFHGLSPAATRTGRSAMTGIDGASCGNVIDPTADSKYFEIATLFRRDPRGTVTVHTN